MYQKNFSFEPPNNRIPVSYPIDRIGQSKLVYFNQGIMNNGKIRPPSSSDFDLERGRTPARSSVWRTNFILVFTPLVLWGFPVHLLFQKRRIYTLSEWLKYLCPCNAPICSLLTILTAVISILYNIAFIYYMGKFLHVLLFTAVLSEEVVGAVWYLIRVVPLVVTLDIFWLRGYKLGNFVASFDRVVVHWKPVDGEKAENNFAEIGKERGKLIIVYGMIICIHGLHYVSVFFHDDRADFSGLSITNQFLQVALVDSIAILATLIMPIYCCFCWAIRYELAMTKEYIQSLIVCKAIPNYAHFDEFKKMSKKITDDVLTVNGTFSILLSAVMGVLGNYVWDEASHLGMTIFQEIVSAISKSDTQRLDPARVRLIVADSVIILVYGALLFVTVWQAVKTNDDIRALHVWLNDFVTEPDSRLNIDLHDSVSVLCISRYFTQ